MHGATARTFGGLHAAPGAHSMIDVVGTQESMMQAIRSTHPGGHVGPDVTAVGARPH